MNATSTADESRDGGPDAVGAIVDFLRVAGDRGRPDAELFALKARAFDLMADEADRAEEAKECRLVADRAREAAAALAGGTCLSCWLFAHSRCERPAACTCPSCYPHRRPPPEGGGEHA